MGYKNPSLVITVCHQPASLVMPIGDPWDRFYYPTLTLMMDTYNLALLNVQMKVDIVCLSIQCADR